MRKQSKKISLSRETLVALEDRSGAWLPRVQGGAATLPPVCENSGNAINTCTHRC